MLTKKIHTWMQNTNYGGFCYEDEERDYLFILLNNLITRAKTTNGKIDVDLWAAIRVFYQKHSHYFFTMYDDLKKSYETVIKFGTAGVRNKLGAGPGRINAANIIFLTKAVTRFYSEKFSKKVLQEKKVLVIGDSRLHSSRFVHLVAAILTNRQIKVVMAPHNLPTPTPFASYATQRFNYLGAIVITASHNNFCDNGYKLYNEKGQQLMSSETNLISYYFAEERNKKIDCNLEPIDSKYLSFVADDDYFNYGEQLVGIIARKFNLDLTKKKRITSVTYSSQFGSSHMFLPRALRNIGYKVHLVQNQSFFDSQFHGLEMTMNPENFSVYHESIKVAVRAGSEIVLHTDCDGDRIGVCVYSHKRAQWEYLHTTHIAILIILYLHEHNSISLVGRHLVSSFVSGSLIIEIAQKFKMITHETPTGPKNLVAAMVNDCDNNCLFAFEQSNGFLLSEQIPDKDGLTAAVMIVTMFEHFLQQGLKFDDIQDQVGRKYGYLAFHESAVWLTNSHSDELIAQIFALIRGGNVLELQKFGKFKIHNFSESNNPNSKSNFYKIEFSKHNWIIVRLSNTERKLKFYVHCVTDNGVTSQKMAKNLLFSIDKFANRVLANGVTK